MLRMKRARGKKFKNKQLKQNKDNEDKGKSEAVKSDEPKRTDEKSNKINTLFKSEELQEICSILKTEELSDQHCFLGAVVIGKFDVVKKLLKDGHPINFVDENRDTAVILAVKHVRLEMVDFLVTRGADISLVDAEGNNVLLLAAMNPNWDEDSFSSLWLSVRDHPKLRPDHGNKAGYTLLHYVTKRQWRGILEQLMRMTVALDCVTNKGVTPLIIAASHGDSHAVKALLEAGADITVEDQKKCTALCYAIAFSLKKNVTEPIRALELILAAVNDENSKLPLEVYLQRRLDLLVAPPKSRPDFSKVVTSVLVHVLIFFARFIYSGMDLLMDLLVFHRLREALERHSDDPGYLSAVMLVVLELSRHCECCCQGLTQAELADAFFSTGLGKCCLDILTSNGANKSVMTKAVFQPLLYLCSSESYKARTWLETNYKLLQNYYNKYMRSFPILFHETNGDPHAEIERQRSLSFQNIMKTLKTQGHIVTKEEHSKAAQKMKEDGNPVHSVYSIMKPISSSSMVPLKSPLDSKPSVSMKRKKSNPAVYNSIIQYNFGKLDIVQGKNNQPIKEQQSIQGLKKEEPQNPPQTPKQKARKGKKSRLAIKEIQINESPRSESSQVQNSIENNLIKEENTKSTNNDNNSQTSEESPCKKKALQPEIKERFSEGYQLFQLEDESITDVSDEESATRNTCEWLEPYVERDGSKMVSDVEVANTLKYLEEIFSRIIRRYDSTWKKQYMDGYLDAKGSPDDLIKLMSVLPALENYHMEKLIRKWDNFIKQIKDHARKNHIVYAALVSEIQLFLLEFEAELDIRNVKILDDDESSSFENDLDTEQILKNKDSENLNILSDGKPIENLINKNSLKNIDLNSSQSRIGIQDEASAMLVDELNENKIEDFIDSIYISDSEDENGLGSSIWDTKLNDVSGTKSKSETELIVDFKAGVVNEDIVDGAILKSTENSGTEIIETVISELIIETSKVNSKSCSVMDMELEEINIEHCLAIAESIISITPTDELKENEMEKDDEIMDTKDSLTLVKTPETFKPKVLPTSPPPGFENSNPLNPCFEDLASVLMYSGPKYQTLCLELVSLPACKTALLDGGNLRLVSLEFQQDFKLFNGCNFGDVELGLSSKGMPLAVRRFQKFNTRCNKAISETLYKCIRPLLHLNNPYVLPYITVYDQPLTVIIAAPLCQQDLGQYVRQIRMALTERPNSLPTITPCLSLLARQLMEGLHYLHTQDDVIIHGNLKPSNVMVDASGSLRLAEFGVHEVLFQQHSAALTTQIWWARECHINYFNTWKFVCTQQSDIQAAGMLLHFIVTVGMHPYGLNLTEIIENIKKGVILLRTQDVIALDLIYWMLSHEPDKRPTTFEVLRHVFFWDTNKRWDFLLTCCGETPLSAENKVFTVPIDQFYKDLDFVGKLRDVNTKWISVLQQNCEQKIGSNIFEDTPSGLLKFLKKNLHNWAEVKDVFLQMFPLLTLNLFRLLEQTVWIDHAALEPFTRVEPLSKP